MTITGVSSGFAGYARGGSYWPKRWFNGAFQNRQPMGVMYAKAAARVYGRTAE
ncbi:MAG: hypothetical protein ABI705_07235 [Aestuariivirga sp.]